MRLIDADALDAAFTDLRFSADGTLAHWGDRPDWCLHGSEVEKLIENAPTIGGWTSVKDGLPKEHPSFFAKYYGTEKWSKGMWRNESDRVLVTIMLPGGTCTVDQGKLQDGIWKTGVSPALPHVVTHWAMWPEPAKEGNENDKR